MGCPMLWCCLVHCLLIAYLHHQLFAKILILRKMFFWCNVRKTKRMNIFTECLFLKRCFKFCCTLMNNFVKGKKCLHTYWIYWLKKNNNNCILLILTDLMNISKWPYSLYLMVTKLLYVRILIKFID